MATPVYLFTGFLDSGKTTLIKDTLSDPNFMEGVSRTLIVCFEQGEEEYEEDWLNDHHAFIEYVDDVETFTPEKMHELDTIYHPDQVFIEWNGTLAIPESIISNMPDFWPLVQILTPVDASTFATFMGPLRQMMYEQIRYSDTVICNRCTEETSGSMLRGNIKAINRRAQIFYEGNFGEAIELKDGGLPFDINAPIIDIKDDDYGLWYLDISDNPEKYDGKTVKVKGMYHKPDNYPKGSFVHGRKAMTCCEEDISLIGLICITQKDLKLKNGDWITITAKVSCRENKQYNEKMAILLEEKVEKSQEPENTLVSFS